MLVDGRLRHGSATELLSDADLVSSARLRQPLVLQAAAQLGLDPSGVRSVPALVEALRAAGSVPEGAQR